MFTINDIEYTIDPDRNPQWKMSVTLAICSLFWKQTPDELATKTTIYKNNKGFSSHDAAKGIQMAKYAMATDPVRVIPDAYIQDAYNMVHKYRKQLVDIMNSTFTKEKAKEYVNQKASMVEATDNKKKKLEELKKIKDIYRKDRIQNMKKEKVYLPDNSYKRSKKVDFDE